VALAGMDNVSFNKRTELFQGIDKEVFLTMAEQRLTHLDEEGKALMVDVSEKSITARTAIASAKVLMKPETLRLIIEKGVPKGDVFAVARIAGIMAAKKTSELIPLCHPLSLSSVKIDFRIDEGSSSIEIISTVRIQAQTGVEMEALTACAVTALTIYDMCKAVDKGMTISDIKLLEKHGGKSGSFVRAG